MTKRILIIGSEGYVGRVLTNHLESLHSLVDGCDSRLVWNELWDAPFVPSNEDGSVRIRYTHTVDYRNLRKDTIQMYDVIILLAGHSSVAMCGDMVSSHSNNVRNFVELLDKLSEEQLLIYASSASVYGNSPPYKHSYEHDPLPPAINNYDMDKQEIDRRALLTNKRTVGLRFGTVNGASPLLRTELMLNSMYLSAQNTGKIQINNKETNRAILGINDLCRAVGTIIDQSWRIKSAEVFNLASFNATIGWMGAQVAYHTGAELIETEDTKTYSFMLNCEKFSNWFSWQAQETVESILESLAPINIPETQRPAFTRNKVIKYE